MELGCWLVAFLVAVVFIALATVIYLSLPYKIRCNVKDKHVFITGGSKGIGKAVAIEMIRRGCRAVSIAARDQKSLEEAVQEMKTLCSEHQTVSWYKLDVTGSYEQIESVVKNAEKESGDVDILVNNAGFVEQGAFADLEIRAFEGQMKTNYLSAVYLTRAVVESMKTRRTGHVAFVSSAAGQCAIWGYTAYSPSKFALRGLAEALHMELLPFRIGVSILFPPNTETEGFQQELKGMTEEIREISNSAGVFTAKEVAQTFVGNIVGGEFTTTIGMEGWMLGVLTAGASPEPNLFKALSQILLGGVFRGVMLVYNGFFNRIVQKCHENKKKH